MRGTRPAVSWPGPPTTVHPRACGELSKSPEPMKAAHGSSPRMRGTLDRLVTPKIKLRFIPAHAGNSTGWLRARTAGPVHPRACGELITVSAAAVTTFGSSPRMRGTLRRQAWDHHRLRFIPAHAGNSYLSFASARHRAGSSPRMRGTHPHHQEKQDGPRFIPAHAGNSRIIRRGTPRTPVHPRACGELSGLGADTDTVRGSSPRMRGTPVGGSGSNPRHRFIPAHAGNSPASSRHGPAWPVHPRACGELNRHSVGSTSETGSSPRMRGTLILATNRQSKRRFIPAHAGNSWP